MQILKEDIRNKIDKAAIELLKIHGYNGITMRKIAKASDMTVGNIYRYYKSKDDLFEQILKPVIEKIMSLLNVDIQYELQGNQEIIRAYVDQTLSLFLKLHKDYSDELYILVHGLKGSCMEDTVSVVIDHLAKHFHDWIKDYNKIEKKTLDVEFTARLIASNLVTSCIEVLYKFDNDEDRLKHMSHFERIYSSFYRGEVK